MVENWLKKDYIELEGIDEKTQESKTNTRRPVNCAQFNEATTNNDNIENYGTFTTKNARCYELEFQGV